MTALEIVSTGTVTVTNDSDQVTGTDTSFATSLVAGGTLYVAGLAALIDTVESETALTLRRAWPGSTAADTAYDIQRQRAEAASTVIANDRLADVIARVQAGTLFRPDAIGTFAGRDAYDDAVEGTVYAVPGAVTGGAPTYYIKLSDDNADWSAGQTTDGVAATIAVGTVSTLAAGEDVTVENVGTTAAAVFDIGIPQGAAGSDGEMAAATYDPNAVAGDAFDMDNMVEGTTTKIMTADERTKLDAIAANVTTLSLPADTTISTYAKSLLAAADAPAAQSILLVRTLLTSSPDYYVRTDGSDSNDGSADTSGAAWLTVDKAVAFITANLDLGVYDVNVHVAAGSYSGAITLRPIVTGGGRINLIGDTTTPANVTLTNTSNVITNSVAGQGSYSFAGFKFISTSGNAISITDGVSVDLGETVFGACGNRGVEVTRGARVKMSENFEINDDIPNWVFRVNMGGFIGMNGVQVTHTGTPAYSSGFIQVIEGGLCHAYSMTIVGTFTGKNYDVDLGSGITLGGGGATYFGGSVAGTIDTSTSWKT